MNTPHYYNYHLSYWYLIAEKVPHLTEVYLNAKLRLLLLLLEPL